MNVHVEPVSHPHLVMALRARPQLGADTYCGDCWEPIVHDGEMWRHIRTGLPATWSDKQCAPLCDWPSCDHAAEPGRSLGKDEWTGHGFRWRASHFLCADHWDAYRRQHVTVEHT